MSLGSGRLRRRARTGLLAEPICAVGHGVAALCPAPARTGPGCSKATVSSRGECTDRRGPWGGSSCWPSVGAGLAFEVPRAPLSGWLLQVLGWVWGLLQGHTPHPLSGSVPDPRP